MENRLKRRRRVTLWVVAVAFSVLAAAPSMTSADEGGDDDVRAFLEKWVETRRIISKERRDWGLGKEILADRIDLVSDEISGIREAMAEAQGSIDEANKKKSDLAARKTKLEEGTAVLREIVAALEARTIALLKRLPDPVKEKVTLLSQRLPENPEETEASLSERFQNVVGILNSVNKFNRDISHTSEVRTLSDGTTAEVTAVYVGIGMAYYVSGDGKSAGIGRGTAEGWTWTPANESAADIAKVVGILRDGKMAEFVNVPIPAKGEEVGK